jgi:hypothetical protein
MVLLVLPSSQPPKTVTPALEGEAEVGAVEKEAAAEAVDATTCNNATAQDQIVGADPIVEGDPTTRTSNP